MAKPKADLFAQLGELRSGKQEEVPQSPIKSRSKGKRSDPSFVQVGAYIRKDTDKAVKRLLVDEDELDFSDLVQSLLDRWVIEKLGK